MYKPKTLFLSDILHTNKAKSQNKVAYLIFLIVAPPQKLVGAPGP